MLILFQSHRVEMPKYCIITIKIVKNISCMSFFMYEQVTFASLFRRSLNTSRCFTSIYKIKNLHIQKEVEVYEFVRNLKAVLLSRALGTKMEYRVWNRLL